MAWQEDTPGLIHLASSGTVGALLTRARDTRKLKLQLKNVNVDTTMVGPEHVTEFALRLAQCMSHLVDGLMQGLGGCTQILGRYSSTVCKPA